MGCGCKKNKTEEKPVRQTPPPNIRLTEVQQPKPQTQQQSQEQETKKP